MSLYQPNAWIEHPLDVLRSALDFHQNGDAFALAMITATDGGGVRTPGALMAVSETGEFAGYVSGGCIDEDVREHAQASLRTGHAKSLRYGLGSPFIDMPLPCGGAIELDILPQPCAAQLAGIVEQLAGRKAVTVSNRNSNLVPTNETAGENAYQLRPKLRLRIAGRGNEPIALAKLAGASGVQSEIWSPDDYPSNSGQELVGASYEKLFTPSSAPRSEDDDHTAFVLMFHDTDWEPHLLKQALEGRAFYVGAVGSSSTHEKRCRLLREHGVADDHIKRIRAPIGVIPSMRDASTLAISILAEITEVFHEKGLKA